MALPNLKEIGLEFELIGEMKKHTVSTLGVATAEDILYFASESSKIQPVKLLLRISVLR